MLPETPPGPFASLDFASFRAFSTLSVLSYTVFVTCFQPQLLANLRVYIAKITCVEVTIENVRVVYKFSEVPTWIDDFLFQSTTRNSFSPRQGVSRVL